MVGKQGYVKVFLETKLRNQFLMYSDSQSSIFRESGLRLLPNHGLDIFARNLDLAMALLIDRVMIADLNDRYEGISGVIRRKLVDKFLSKWRSSGKETGECLGKQPYVVLFFDTKLRKEFLRLAEDCLGSFPQILDLAMAMFIDCVEVIDKLDYRFNKDEVGRCDFGEDYLPSRVKLC